MSGEVSIAELIGWEVCAAGTCWKPPGEKFCTDAKPTVDDLLAWLKGQDRAIYISGGSPHAQWQVRVPDPGNYSQHVLFSKSHNAPTLLAALEAAVRAVAAVPAEDDKP